MQQTPVLDVKHVGYLTRRVVQRITVCLELIRIGIYPLCH